MTLSRICGAEEENVIEFARIFVKDNLGFPEYDKYSEGLISTDIQVVMSSIEYIISDILFNKIVLGKEILDSKPSKPALTEDDIFALGAALYAWV